MKFNESRDDAQWQSFFYEAVGRLGQAGDAMVRAAQASRNEDIQKLVSEIGRLSARCSRIAKRLNKSVDEGLFGGPKNPHVTDEYGYIVHDDDEDDKPKKPSLLKKAWDKTGGKLLKGIDDLADDFGTGIGLYREDDVKEGKPSWKAPTIKRCTWDGTYGEVVFFLGKIADKSRYNSEAKRCSVDVSVRIDKQGYFAASGGIWNARGTDITLGGQILDDMVDPNGDIYPELPRESQALLDTIIPLWEKYHLSNIDSIPDEDFDKIIAILDKAKEQGEAN